MMTFQFLSTKFIHKNWLAQDLGRRPCQSYCMLRQNPTDGTYSTKSIQDCSLIVLLEDQIDFYVGVIFIWVYYMFNNNITF